MVCPEEPLGEMAEYLGQFTMSILKECGTNRASELRQEIREAWAHMEPPILPPPLRDDWIEYPDTYRAVDGKLWDSINLGVGLQSVSGGVQP